MAMTMADNSIRKACDRCHSQKLSCRRVGEEPCERCTRLKTECKFSPSLRYKKQNRQQKQQHQPQQTQIHQHQPQQQQQQQPPDHQHQHQPQAQQVYGHQQPPPPPPQHHHHIHHQHYQQVPHQDTLGAETVPVTGSRSPKRRRTSSDPILVLPEAVPVVSGTEGLTGKPHSVVTSETGLDISEFNFNFDQLGFFAPPHSEHLSHPTVLSESLHAQPVQPAGVFIEPWDHRLPANSESFPVIDHAQPQPQPQPQQPLSQPQPELHHSPRLPSSSSSSSVAFRRRGCPPEQSTNSDNSTNTSKRPRFRTRQRPRQIALRDTATLGQLQEPSSSPVTSWETSSAHWMAQLSEINTRLLDLSSALPQTQEAAQPLGRPSDERFKANGFPIDEMFKLTRRVADILDQLTATTMDGDAAAARQARRDSADPANSMFVLSTYVRLLDMYQKVFSLVQTELAETNLEAAFRFWKLPDVTVGSFAVESSPSLQMSLTIQLAEEFLFRLRNATAALNSSLRNGEDSAVNGQAAGGASPSSSASLFSGVVDVSYQAVKSREESLGKHLAELRAEIESMLDG